MIDAESAGRAVLSGSAEARARSADGPVDMLHMLKLAKGSAMKSRTQTSTTATANRTCVGLAGVVQLGRHGHLSMSTLRQRS